MKVLQVSKFYPPVMGGIESVAWELTEGLNRAGVSTDVLCANQQPRTVHDVTSAEYAITRAGSFGRLLSTSISPALVTQMLRLRARYNIIHVHMPDPMAALALWLTRPRPQQTVVVHWHSDVVRQRVALRLYEPLQHWLLERANAIIATSEAYAKSSEVLRVWRAKVAVIPIGISDNRADGCSDQAVAIRQRFRKRKLVFALGRMTYYKGFEVLIDAAAALPDDCAVLIGGDGELMDRYRTQILRRGLAGKVHLPGKIPEHELASHYEACDVFCMPSTARTEAYGVAMLEAMVMGKPIVASDIGGSGVPWVNVDGVTGFNVPVGQADALAGALGRLLQDVPLRKRMGEASRRRYVTDFNATLMTQRILGLYEHALGAPTLRPA